MGRRGLGLVLVCWVLIGCGPEIGEERSTPYTESVYAEFLADCRRQNHPRDLCDCMYNYYAERVEFGRFRAILDGAEIPHAIVDDIAARCGVRVS